MLKRVSLKPKTMPDFTQLSTLGRDASVSRDKSAAKKQTQVQRLFFGISKMIKERRSLPFRLVMLVPVILVDALVVEDMAASAMHVEFSNAKANWRPRHRMNKHQYLESFYRPFENGSMTHVFWVTTPFLKGFGDSR